MPDLISEKLIHGITKKEYLKPPYSLYNKVNEKIFPLEELISRYNLPYLNPKKQRTPRELDALEQYLLRTIETDAEAITPVVEGERVLYKPDRHFIHLSGLPKDVRDIVIQLGEVEIWDNLRDVIWHYLNKRDYQMRFPVVDKNGGVAILVSDSLKKGENPEQNQYWNDLIGRFYFNLFKRLNNFDGVELGKQPVLWTGATTEDLKEAVHDPYFSSIITVGHGRYGVWGATDEGIDWAHVASYSAQSNHLKSGFWMHLTCTPIDEEPLSGMIPFPYFAMRDQNNILGLQDRNGHGRLYYSEEFVGVNGTVEPVRLERIAQHSFLPKLEAWKKVLKYNPTLEALFKHGQELTQSQDPFWRELGKYLLQRSIKL